MSGSKEPIAQTNMLNAIWELQCCMSTFSQPTNILIFFTLDIKYFIFELSFLQIVHYKRPLWFAYVSRVFHMVLLCSVFIPVHVEIVLYGLCVARFHKERRKNRIEDLFIVLACVLQNGWMIQSLIKSIITALSQETMPIRWNNFVIETIKFLWVSIFFI